MEYISHVAALRRRNQSIEGGCGSEGREAKRGWKEGERSGERTGGRCRPVPLAVAPPSLSLPAQFTRRLAEGSAYERANSLPQLLNDVVLKEEREHFEEVCGKFNTT
ncbi:hypothetical protein GW17_00038490 [Ensete ventricosum]|uniref:Uncharacterized protein n=1 Tax=Ensete ventricosum TaxID=4639 RepID=A0A444DKK0_ENSVE|nr:hypothetical protein GW17_00038490 [Ensete ventricosum]RZR72703.1 hypothetical protein BHM03_00015960 [Ensete ventricosum]